MMSSAEGDQDGGTSPSGGDRRSRALTAYARQFGVSEDEVVPLMRERFGPRLTEEALSAGGSAWVEDELSLRDRSLVVLTALVTQGGVESRLRSHVGLALMNGATPEEIEAAVSLLGSYAGFPRASTAMEVIVEELERLGQPLDGE